MRNNERIAELLITRNVARYAKPSPLARPSPFNFAEPADREAAQRKLQQRRKGSKEDPQKGFRAKAGLRKQAKIDKLNTTFTLNERRDAFDELLQNQEPVGIAQAVMDFHPEEPYDVNIRQELKPKGSILSRERVTESTITPSRWLQVATEQGQRDYVQLLASRNPKQNNLDESLKIAIRRNFIQIIEDLLRYNANPNACHDDFQRLVGSENTTMMSLLLRSIHKLEQSELNKALIVAVRTQSLEVVKRLLAFGADVNSSSGQVFTITVELRDCRLLTLLVSTPGDLRAQSLRSAVQHVCTGANFAPGVRHDILEILLAAGATIPSDISQPFLNMSVVDNDIDVVSLLVHYKQIPSNYATRALSQLPKNLTEDEALAMSNGLFKAQAEAVLLGSILAWVTEKSYTRMIARFVELGVSLDYKDAQAVCFALRRQDLRLLNQLLNGNGRSGTSTRTPSVLAKALKPALEINNKATRHQAVSLLLQKGVSGPDLDRALLDVVSRPDICDLDLIHALLAGGAQLSPGNGIGSCILVAARDSNLAALDLLSAPDWSPSYHDLTTAVSLVFDSRSKSAHSEVVRSMSRLLQRGADCNSDTVSQTLVKAIESADDNESLEIAQLLLSSGANVNYNYGQAIEAALKLNRHNVLESICLTDRISQVSFSTNLQLAIFVSRENPSKARTLLNRCQTFKDVISKALVDEVASTQFGGQDGIVDLLLSNGADVNYHDGAIFTKVAAIETPAKSIARLDLFLGKNPQQIALGTAFNTARRLQFPLGHRLTYFKLILEAGYKGPSIHPALIEVINVDKDDVGIPSLLLLHGASVNHDNGTALSLAAESGNARLLNTLLAHGPEKTSAERALISSCLVNMAVDRRIDIFKCLLKSRVISPQCVTHALTHVVVHGTTDQTLLKLLTDHGGLLEVEALLALIGREDVATTQSLFKSQTPSREIRSQAFHACLTLDRTVRLAFAALFLPIEVDTIVWTPGLHISIQDHDHDLLTMLLENRRNGEFQVGEALTMAATTLDPTTVGILLSNGTNDGQRNTAFRSMLLSERMHHSTESRQAATLLLDQGIDQSLKDQALVQSLQFYRVISSDFYKTLIARGGDVNTRSCLCFYLASQFDNSEVFRHLLDHGPDYDTVVEILVGNFPQQFGDRLVEHLFLTLEHNSYRSKHLKVEIVFEAMRRFPNGKGLLRLLLEHGYPAGDTIIAKGGHNVNSEAVTPLIWALAQPDKFISDTVILALLEEGEKAHPSFSTTQSGITAVSLAAQFSRHDVIDRLLELKVDTSAKDSLEKSPLYYAAANNDVMAVHLLSDRAQANDGSLHEAARHSEWKLLAMLMERHDPDFPSDLHGGRTALGELCFRSTVVNGAQESQAYKAMELLLNRPVDLGLRNEGRTILHLALENIQPVVVLKTLLRFPQIYEDIRGDSDKFTFEDSRGITMSPDRYVSECCKHDENVKHKLKEMLSKKSCKEKWFKLKGQQLPDCVGLPPGLKEEHDQQDLADQVELRAIDRRRMSARADIDIERRTNNFRLEESKRQTAQTLENTQRIHSQQLENDNARAIQDRQNAKAQRSDERSHRQSMAQIEYNSRNSILQLEYSSQQQKENSRLSAMGREQALRSKMLSIEQDAESSSHRRAIERYNRQDASARTIAAEQRSLLQAARAANVNPPQLAIEHPD
ncbi:hypothetical protein BT63DRAFT_157442 [Microthyrium microscopicum]|uniref:Ankyrin n=1 Tax=Microthyrium microscopicum TaxID=703497 RepID=A0A6A6UQX9_9PEZI|nr:hypothetical protein BT63DRAFT_157442 [Microthyrium microscopicum]